MALNVRLVTAEVKGHDNVRPEDEQETRRHGRQLFVTSQLLVDTEMASSNFVSKGQKMIVVQIDTTLKECGRGRDFYFVTSMVGFWIKHVLRRLQIVFVLENFDTGFHMLRV